MEKTFTALDEASPSITDSKLRELYAEYLVARELAKRGFRVQMHDERNRELQTLVNSLATENISLKNENISIKNRLSEVEEELPLLRGKLEEISLALTKIRRLEVN